jgi:hypothetical protein
VVEINGLFHDCPACRGEGYIIIGLRHVVNAFDFTDGPEKILPSSKRYPCPECQKVFYHSDLDDLNAVEPMRQDFKEREAYVNHLKLGIAQRLGRMMVDRIKFTEHDVPEHMPFGYVGLRGRVFVVNRTALKREFQK